MSECLKKKSRVKEPMIIHTKPKYQRSEALKCPDTGNNLHISVAKDSIRRCISFLNKVE